MYYFKKYITVTKSHSKIYFHHLNNLENSLVFKYNDKNIESIEYLLDNGVRIEEIEKNIIYKKLLDKGFLYTNSSFQKKENINRTELFLNYLYDDLTYKKIENVKETPILIYGVGGGGSSLVYLLAQFGFKNMYIVDYDIVEISDVRRTMTFDKSDISKSKVSSLKDKIYKNFLIDIKIFEGKYSEEAEIEDLINLVKPDFIINACDPKPSFKLDLNKLCFKYNIPYIVAAYSYETLYVGPIYVPSVTSCENSFNEYFKETFGKEHGYEVMEKIFTNQLLHPSNSFNINILASLMFKEIILFLIGKFEHCQTIGRRVFFNPLNYNVYYRNAHCTDKCVICKK